VPLDVLASKIKALQDLVLATAQLTKPVFPKGKKANQVAQQKVHAKDACRLFFRETRKNCLTLDAELPPTTALFEEAADWGVQTVDAAGEVLWALQAKDEKRLRELSPDPTQRLGILRKAGALLPATPDHTVSLKTAHQAVDLTSQIDAFIRGLEAQLVADRRQVQRTVTGRVTKIDTAASPAMVGIRVGGASLVCELLSEIAEQVEGNLTTGTVVEVTGKAVLGKKGKVLRILEANHLRPLGQEPLHWTRITHEDRAFELTKPLTVTVHWDGEGWIFEAEEIGIVGFGRQRREASLAFGHDFAACWDNIALIPDEGLTEDAIEMKGILKALVKSCGVDE